MLGEALRVRVTGGFVVSFALMLLFCGTDGFVAALCCTLLHELAHAAAVGLCGGSVVSFTMTFGGFSMEGRFPRGTSYPREIVCLLSGTAANLTAGTVLRYISGNDPFLHLLAGANLTLGLFNLNPAGALDGGKTLRLMTEARFGPKTAEAVGTVVSAVFAAGVLTFGVILLLQKADWKTLTACIYLSFFLGYDIISVNRRQWNAAEKPFGF